jgi:hypothetical protein
LFLLLAGCGGDGDGGPTGPHPSREVTLQAERVAAGIEEELLLFEPMDIAPSGDGGFYFMDWMNVRPPQRVYRWAGARVQDTGLTPSAVLEAMGQETAAGQFEDLDSDASGRLYLLLSYVETVFAKALLRVSFQEQSVAMLVPPDVFATLYAGAGLTMDAVSSVATRMLVTPGGDVWLAAVDGEGRCVVFLLRPRDAQVEVQRWMLSEQYGMTFSPSLRLGPGGHGDLLITDVPHGVLWRVSPSDGAVPFLSLKNLPKTLSAFCETPEGRLVFATNFVVDIVIEFIHDGLGETVEAIWSVFAGGVDRLFYLIPTSDGFEAHVWDTSELIQPHVQDPAGPEFWFFCPDPGDGSLWVADVAGLRGDVYRLRFSEGKTEP